VEALGVDDATAASWFLSATGSSADGTSEFSACLSPELVPVILASFTAESGNEGVRLAWVTASETDHLGFHVLRRVAGQEWVRLTEDLVEGGPEYAFLDPEPVPGRENEYTLEAWARDGSRQRLGSVRTMGMARPVGIALRALPNPIRSSGTLVFALAEPGRVEVEIISVTGRRLHSLVDAVRPAGEHRISWDGTDASGRHLASGSYIAVLRTSGETRTLKLVLLR
jgi:hypothetical protein